MATGLGPRCHRRQGRVVVDPCTPRTSQRSSNWRGISPAPSLRSKLWVRGVPRRRLVNAERSGVIRRIHPSVFYIGPGAVPRRALVHAAVLAGGRAALPSHESALFLHDVDSVPFEVVLTLGPTGRTDLVGVRVHRFADLRDEHLCTVAGVRTTTIERAMVDVATCFTGVRTEWLIDHLTITTRRTALGKIARVLRQINRRGRPGIGNLVNLLDERGPGVPTPRSELERLADRLLDRTVLPVPRSEFPLPSLLGTGHSDQFVDRAWPDAKLILEIDGRRWHSRERDMAKDRRRDRQAAAAGWQTLRVLGEEVRDLPDDVAAEIAAAHDERRFLLGQTG